ncbi:MAG TPA: cadmium resistance transporter [Trebonia sp.]|nr:cadmium resistance transporter [Trebonia sp.]
MSSPVADAVTAVVLFSGTNVDDLLLISLFSAHARSRSGSLRSWHVWAGQYLGFGALIAASALIGRGLALAPERWLWLLALIPLGIGVVTLASALRARSRAQEPHPPPPRSAWGVAVITIIDGADDLAAYTPFFAAAGAERIWVTCAMFVACVAAWCLAGGLLTRHPRVVAAIERHDWWVLPAAFIFIGVYVLLTTLSIA